MSAQHTQGPWRWEINEKHRSVHLVGGRPFYDLTIIEPIRWGMNGATFHIRDTAVDGMNLMHKLHDRRDWIAPFPGRAHHASWCANVVHPDMRLIAAAPELLEALTRLLQVFPTDVDMAEAGWNAREIDDACTAHETAVAAVRNATGDPK
jgi:hypothetical protein